MLTRNRNLDGRTKRKSERALIIRPEELSASTLEYKGFEPPSQYLSLKWLAAFPDGKGGVLPESRRTPTETAQIQSNIVLGKIIIVNEPRRSPLDMRTYI